MNIIYNKNKNVEGQFIKTLDSQTKPIVNLFGLDNKKKYILIMYDPDAVGGNFIHWIVTQIPGNYFDKGYPILDYYNPHPPKGSGLHRYIFSLYLLDFNSDSNFNLKMNNDERQIELNSILKKFTIKNQPIYSRFFFSKYKTDFIPKKSVKAIKNKKNKTCKKRK